MDPQAQRRALCCELVSEVARSAGQVRLQVHGASMLPALWPGDVLTVQRCSCGDLRPGQLLLFRRNGTLTAHRVVRAGAASAITRGDALPACDEPVQAGEVVGQVVEVLRNGRIISSHQFLLQRPSARLLSWLLARSELCTRILLLAAGRLRALRPHSASEHSRAAASALPPGKW
jgi:hypothetical protein